ncbi:MAG: metallophosphoesterase family protein, partial [Planctomycetota bacterium]
MSIIGLLSDSHGHADTTARGVRLLLDNGAEVLIHLGDIGSEAVIDAMVCGQGENGRLNPMVHVVPGNTDWNAVTLLRY